jgi:predicted ester cyclase
MKVSVDNIGAAGGVVVMEFTFSGTQKGALGPIKATGKTFSIHGIDFDTMNGDKLSKASTYSNSIELLKQLGMIPEKKK